MRYIFFLIRSFLIFLVLSLFTSHYVLALSEPPNLNIVNLGDAFSDVGNSSKYDGPNSNWNNVEQITGNMEDQRGALWYKDPLDFNKDFEGDFYLYLGNSFEAAGDGMTFIFQHNTNRSSNPCSSTSNTLQLCALGAKGGAMGSYGKWDDAVAIQPAIALEFDTYLNLDPNEDGSDRGLPKGDDYKNHIALTVPGNLSKGDPIAHYQPKGFKCSNDKDDSCLSNGKWRYIKYKWSEKDQKMLYWIKNREEDDRNIATFCFQFGKQTCKNPEGNDVTQPDKIQNKKNANDYFGSNAVYWGFTGSTGLFHAQQLVAVGRNPNQFQKPLDLKVSLSIDNDIDKSGFKVSLEAYNDNEHKWKLFKPDGKDVCQDYSFDQKGEVHISSVSNEEKDQECLALVKKYGGTKDYKQFRFIITESPEYYPQYGRYIADSENNPIVSSESLELNDSILGAQSFGIIHTYENKWGECPWDLNNDGLLKLGKEQGTKCILGSGNNDKENIVGIAKKQVKVISFENNIQLPIAGSGQYFARFSSVTQYKNIEKLDTSETDNMNNMFWENESLEKLNVSSFKTEKVKNMNGMFDGVKNLEQLEGIENFKTNNVSSFGGMINMFQNAEKLETLDLSSFDTSNVTRMDGMFKGAKKLETLDLSSFDTSNVTNMYSMFQNAEKLETLDLSNFDTSNVTRMNGMFQNAKSLTELNISSFNTEKVENMTDMFAGADAIEQLYLGEKFQFQPSNDKTKAALPNIEPNDTYTGGWVNLKRGNSFKNSQALMENYDGQKDSGTYIRQMKTSLSVPETIKFSGWLNYNEQQSIEPDSSAKVSASSYQGDWKVVMRLVEEDSNELFKNYLYYDEEQISTADNEIFILTGKASEEKELELPLTMRIDPLASLDPLADENYTGKFIYTLEITLN